MMKYLVNFITCLLLGWTFFSPALVRAQCAAPLGVGTSSPTFNTVLAQWNSVPGANSYQMNFRALGTQNWSTQGTGNVTSATVYGLTGETSYEFRVRANCTGSGFGAFSNVVLFTTQTCLPPATVSISNVNLTTVSVNWSASSGAVSYEINFRPVGTQNWSTQGAGNVTSATVYGLTANTSYEVRVKANCGVGGWSAFSSPSVQFTTLTCLPPTTVSLGTITNTTAVVNWTASAFAVSYEISYRALGAANWSTQGAGNVTTKTLNGLQAGKDYEVRVRANCAAGGWSAFGNSVEFTTGGCTAPSNLTTNNLTLTGATAQWNAVSGVSGYTVNYRIQGTQTWTSVNVGTNNYALTGLTSGTTYEIRVRSRCGTLLSAWTATTNFTTLTCQVPANLTTTNISYTSATLNWNAVSGAIGYTVNYRIQGAGSWISAAAETNNLPLLSLTPGTIYEFRVQTNCGSSVNSAFSSVSNFTTLTCPTPTGLAIINITPTGATFSWDAVSGASGYTVNYRIQGAGSWTTVNANNSTYILANLALTTVYEVRVQTNCGAGNVSAFSNIVNFTTLNCSVPTEPIVTNVGYNSASFYWTPIPGMPAYWIRYKRAENDVWSYQRSTIASATIYNLFAGNIYNIQISSACGDTLLSAFTQTVNIVTLAEDGPVQPFEFCRTYPDYPSPVPAGTQFVDRWGYPLDGPGASSQNPFPAQPITSNDWGRTCGNFKLYFGEKSTQTNGFYDSTPFNDANYPGVTTQGELRRSCACKAFEELSQIIQVPANIHPEILLLGENDVNSQALAAGTSFYSVTGTCKKSALETYIQSGTDWTPTGVPAAGTLTPTAFHGILTLNFGVSTFNAKYVDNDVVYGQVRLYNILQHEAMHALGFNAGITENGTPSTSGGFDFYAQLLVKDDLTTRLSDGGCSALHAGVTAADLVSNSLYYKSPNYPSHPQVKLYVPNLWTPGNSLSHFDETTSVMYHRLPLNPYRMSPGLSDIFALCDLGYTLKPSYTSACNNATTFVVPVPDKAVFHTAEQAPPYCINVLANDTVINGSKAGLTVALQDVLDIPADWSVTIGANAMICLTPPPNFTGSILLRYKPQGVGALPVPFTTLEVAMVQFSCSYPNNCELVCNGKFESGPAPNNWDVYWGMLSATSSAAHLCNVTIERFGWCGAMFTPDIVVKSTIVKRWFQIGNIAPSDSEPESATVTCNTGTSFYNTHSGGGNRMLRLSSRNLLNDGSYTIINEGAFSKLKTPLQPGENYQISFWANSCLPNALRISFHNQGIIGTDVDNANPIYDVNDAAPGNTSISITPDTWERYSFVYQHPSGAAQEPYLIIRGGATSAGPIFTGFQNGWIYVDDVSIKSYPVLTSVVLPDDPCTGIVKVVFTTSTPILRKSTISAAGAVTVINSGGTELPSTIIIGPGDTFTNTFTVEFNAPATGTYQVCINNQLPILQDQCGPLIQHCFQVPVNIPVPQVTLSVSPSPVCPGGQATYTAAITGGQPPYTCQWYFNGDLQSGVTGPILIIDGVQPSGAGAIVLVTDANGCSPVQSNVAVPTFSPLPTATVTITPNPVCVGGQVTVTVSNPNCTSCYYNLFDVTTNGNVVDIESDQATPAFTFNTVPSSNNIYLLAIHDYGTGCDNTITVTIPITTVKPAIQPPGVICSGVPFTIRGLNLCEADPFYFDINQAYFVKWTLDGDVIPATGTTNNTSLFVTNGLPAGNHSVSIALYNDQAGNSLLATSIITTFTVVQSPFVSISALPGQSVCVGQPFTLTANVANPNPCVGCTYSWTGPNGFVSQTTTDPTLTIPFAAMVHSGTYTVTVTNNPGGCTGTATVNVIIHEKPIIESFTAIGNCTGPNGTVRLTIQMVNVGAYTYTFTGPGIAGGATAQNISDNIYYEFPANGVSVGDVYSVTVTNGNCTATTTATVTITQTPIITTGSNQGTFGICAGSTLNLTASADNCAGCTYSWAGPNGFTSDQQNPSLVGINILNGGTYTVTVNNNGCTAVAGVPVTVNTLPRPILTVAPNPVCVGTQVTFTATPQVPFYTYTLTGNLFNQIGQPQVGNGVFTGFTPTSFLNSGIYTVSVQDNITGCVGIATVNLTVNPLPQFTANATPNPVCGGSFIQLTSNVFNNCPTCNVGWTGQNVFLTNVPNTTATPSNQAATLIYTFTVTNPATQCQASQMVTVNVNPRVLITSLTAAPSPVCAGTPVTLTGVVNAPFGATATYTWTGPDLASVQTQTPTVTFNAVTPGTSTYTLTATTQPGGCLSFRTIQVTVNPTTINLTGITPPAAPCAGREFTLTPNATLAPGHTYKYRWLLNGEFFTPELTTNGPTVPPLAQTPSTPGTYTYTFIVVDDQTVPCSATTETVVVVGNCCPNLTNPQGTVVYISDDTDGTPDGVVNYLDFLNQVFDAGIFTMEGNTFVFVNCGLNLSDINSYTINNANFYFSPGFGIDVPPINSTVSVTFNNSVLTSCSCLWNGINADNVAQTTVGNATNVTLNNTTVTRAELGLYARHGTVVNLTGSTFKDNYSHVGLADYYQAIDPAGAFISFGNDFMDSPNNTIKGRFYASDNEFVNTLNPGAFNADLEANNCPAVTLPTQIAPFAGITAHRVQELTVGDPKVNLNSFEKLRWGVKLLNDMNDFIGPGVYLFDPQPDYFDDPLFIHRIINNHFEHISDDVSPVKAGTAIHCSVRSSKGFALQDDFYHAQLTVGTTTNNGNDGFAYANTIHYAPCGVRSFGYDIIEVGRNTTTRVDTALYVSEIMRGNATIGTAVSLGDDPINANNFGFSEYGCLLENNMHVRPCHIRQNVFNKDANRVNPPNEPTANTIVTAVSVAPTPGGSPAPNGSYKFFNMDGNRINFSGEAVQRNYTGLFFGGNPQSDINDITNNTITFASGNAIRAVGLDVNLSFADRFFRIGANNIGTQANPADMGIRVWGENFPLTGQNENLIDNNNIFIRTGATQPNATYGIQLNGVRAFRARGNAVTRTTPQGAQPDWSYGVDVTNINNMNLASVTCNTLTNVAKGVRFAGATTGVNSRVMSNTFTRNFYGIAVENNAALGNQGGPGDAFVPGLQSDNQWFPPTFYNQGPTGPHAALARFMFDNTFRTNLFVRNDGNIATLWNPIALNADADNSLFCNYTTGFKESIFRTANATIPYNCMTFFLRIAADETNVKPFLGRVAGDSIEYGALSVQQKYYGKRLLYDWLSDFSDLRAATPAFQQQFDSLALTNIDRFRQVDQAVQDSLYTTARLLNSFIVPIGQVELNLQRMNAIYLNYVIAGATGVYENGDSVQTTDPPFTPFDWNRIVGTANQCYYAGGPAVLTARMLRSMVDRTHHFYPDDCLNPDSPFGAKNESPTKETTGKEALFTLYPNPTRGLVWITANLPVEATNAKLTVQNAMGVEVYNGVLKNGTDSLNVERWSAGIYLCTFDYEGKRYNKKLVVTQ